MQPKIFHRALSFLLIYIPVHTLCFSLALIRLPLSNGQSVTRYTANEINKLISLSDCHQVPYGYFDIAQFIPDDVSPLYLQRNGIQTNPLLNPYWIRLKGIVVMKVEFYTGSSCQNAVYEQDQEAFLRQSQMKKSRSQIASSGMWGNTQDTNTDPDLMMRPQIRKRPSVQMNAETPLDMMQAQIRRPSLSSTNEQGIQEINNQQMTATPMDAEMEEDANYYPNFDIEFPESEMDPELAIGKVDQRFLEPSQQEQMEVEPPVAHETKQEEIGRQERNLLRFYLDTEPDGGVALDKSFTTLKWSERWRSFKFSYKFNSLSSRRTRAMDVEP